MACESCSTGTDGKPGGCQSKGGCSSGGCNRLNTYDWLSKLDIYDSESSNLVEVSFKQGSRKGFFQNQSRQNVTGDMVVVETDSGYDIGKISLSGELVRLQMKKKRVKEDSVFKNVIRRANERDLDRMQEARSLENQTMIRARAIARTLDLDMKIGDVEYQADKRKATFFYTADGRVDFRELIRHFAKEFRVKIEMRQIGARQESARIGGIGSCGRELCCSTWLSDFKTVSTAAARYQNLAINQAKLSGQCGRLKCCLNYELDTYMDALEEFPEKADTLFTEVGKAILVKTDIFKGLMYYTYLGENGGRGKFYPLDLNRVKEILALNKDNQKPTDLIDIASLMEEEVSLDFESVNEVIDLPIEKRRRNRRNRNRKNKNRSNKPKSSNSSSTKTEQKSDTKNKEDKTKKPSNRSNKSNNSNRRNRSSANKSNPSTKTNPKGNNKTNAPAKANTSTKPKAEGDTNKSGSNKGSSKGKRNFRRNNNKKKKE